MRSRLALALAMLASLWPAAALVEAAGGHISLRLPAVAPWETATGPVTLAVLEADQRELATDAAGVIDSAPAPDIAARADRLRADTSTWLGRHHGSRAATIASSMRDLDRAVAALATSPSPGAQLAFEHALSAYDAEVSSRRLI